MKDQFVGERIELDNALAFWVYRVYQGTRRELYRSFLRNGQDITPEQWLILVRLWESDGRTQSDLCESTIKDRPTISRAIDVLETRGIVERRSSPEDGRLRSVFLTRTGKELQRKLVPVVRSLVGQLEGGLNDPELCMTRQTLKQMAGNLDQLAEQAELEAAEQRRARATSRARPGRTLRRPPR